MQSTVTDAFLEWNVNKILAGEPAVPDRMVFALIPGQDAGTEISPDEGMPAETEIIYSTALTQSGKVNENAVVYSVVLDTTIGDWSYNWVGLADSETGTVLMIVHCDEQRKIKTQNGQQGNSLIRNMVMEFTGAAEATQITVTPESWQIDYSARHAGADERTRTENIDIYDVAAFEGGGFLVTGAGDAYSAAAGLGYVAGLRCESAKAISLPAVSGATKVWIDATWQGTVTGPWSVSYSLRLATGLEDYEKDGFQHYVFAIADIAADGQVTDLRPPFPLQQLQEQADKDFLRVDAHLKEIKDAGQVAQKEARENIDTPSIADITAIDKEITAIKAACPHKIGDVLFRGNNTSPTADWPGTDWQDLTAAYGGRTVTLGAEPLQTGGANEVTLTAGHVPLHDVDVSKIDISEADDHVHTYYRYIPGGTIDTTNISIDNKKHGSVEAETSPAGKHKHTVSGSASAGSANPAAFSVVSAFVQLRAWMRTA